MGVLATCAMKQHKEERLVKYDAHMAGLGDRTESGGGWLGR